MNLKHLSLFDPRFPLDMVVMHNSKLPVVLFFLPFVAIELETEIDESLAEGW